MEQVQKILDTCLLGRGIMSHHLRRAAVTRRTDGGKIDHDNYVVYRVATHSNRLYGNGAAILKRVTFDINYYYKDTENNADSVAAAAVVSEIEAAFVAAGWRILSGQTDLYDTGGGYKGINIEVAKLEV